MYLRMRQLVSEMETILSTYKVASPMELNMIGHKSVSHPLPIPDAR
jgi:hypothetical protein